MRTAIVALSTLAVALAATCGQTPVKPALNSKIAAGSDKTSRLIVGGDLATPYSWPWMVVWCDRDWANEDYCPVLCSATVIAPDWIMIGASCVYADGNPWNYKAKAGVYNERKSSETAEEVIPARAMFIHPDYDHDLKKNDIALIQLKSNFTIGDHIQPVCLPKTDDVALAPSKDLWVTGWGVTTEDGWDNSLPLRQANVPIVDTETCQQEYPKSFYKEVEFCAGKEGVDACAGDGGSPIVQKDKSGSWYQYGIVSWGVGCGHKGFAGVYTRITAYCDWINKTTNGAAQCQDVL